MAMIKKKRTVEGKFEASSMADITFLLLLFFLVTTTIDVDTGIYMSLPEYVPPDSKQETAALSKDRLITVNINETGDVLISGERMAIPQIKPFLVPKIESKTDLPDNKKLIVSIKTADQTNYNLYIQTLDAIKAAYFEVQEAYCRAKFGVAKYQINDEQKEILKSKIPIVISIAEPEATK